MLSKFLKINQSKRDTSPVDVDVVAYTNHNHGFPALQRIIVALLIVLGLIATPQSATVVTINANGNILVDGTPFFVLGIYNNIQINDYTTSADLARIRNAGINTVMTYDQRDPSNQQLRMAYLDRAQAAGLKVIIGLNEFTNYGLTDSIRSTVLALKDHPALLGWYAFDELWDTVKTQKAYAAIKEMDPNHPVWGVLCCFDEATYTGFELSADIIGFDLYAVGRGSQDMKQRQLYEWSGWLDRIYTPPAHSLMSVSQIFNQYSYSDYGGYTREPTLQEKRLAAYLCLSGGNKGHFFYSYFDILAKTRDGLPWPQAVIDTNLRELSLLGNEIVDIGKRAILKGTRFNAQTQGDTADLKTIGYQVDNEVYVLIGNCDEYVTRSVTVALPLTTWSDKNVSVLYGSLTAVKNGSRLSISVPAKESGIVRIALATNVSGQVSAQTGVDPAIKRTWVSLSPNNGRVVIHREKNIFTLSGAQVHNNHCTRGSRNINMPSPQ